MLSVTEPNQVFLNIQTGLKSLWTTEILSKFYLKYLPFGGQPIALTIFSKKPLSPQLTTTDLGNI